MKTHLIRFLCWSSLLTVLSACPSSDEPEVAGAVIETAIPNGLVPGSALTLKGRAFGAVQSVQFANTTVAVGSFIRTAMNELTLKVPVGTQAGEVRVVGENGPGRARQMIVLTGGSGMTTDNVSTNVNTVTQGGFSDECSPRWFSYCMRGTCLTFYDGYRANVGGGTRCELYNFTTESIAGYTYNVYKGKDASGAVKLTLKCELNRNGTGFTGFVIMETPEGDAYFGSLFKNLDVVGYSKDGSELKMCRPVNNPNRPIDRPCFQITCNVCA